jgi:hypothetical protein
MPFFNCNSSNPTMHSTSQMQISPEMEAKALVLTATGNTDGLPVLSSVPCEVPDLPGKPTCVHTDREQELAQFPGTS